MAHFAKVLGDIGLVNGQRIGSRGAQKAWLGEIAPDTPDVRIEKAQKGLKTSAKAEVCRQSL